MLPEATLSGSEAVETSAAVEWLALQSNAVLRMTFHPASEAKRSVVMGAHLKMQGMLPGIPDLVNPVAPFMLELKVRRNAPSPYQAWWLVQGLRMNIPCGVAYNAAEAIEFFEAAMAKSIERCVAFKRLSLMIEDWTAQNFAIDPWTARGR